MNENEKMLAETIHKSEVFEDGEIKSKILSVLGLRKNMTMSKIEKSCSISEPIASETLKELQNEGYVTQSKTEQKGMGRPEKIYNLTEDWVEKLSNEILNIVREKIDEVRIINTVLSDERE